MLLHCLYALRCPFGGNVPNVNLPIAAPRNQRAAAISVIQEGDRGDFGGVQQLGAACALRPIPQDYAPILARRGDKPITAGHRQSGDAAGMPDPLRYLLASMLRLDQRPHANTNQVCLLNLAQRLDPQEIAVSHAEQRLGLFDCFTGPLVNFDDLACKSSADFMLLENDLALLKLLLRGLSIFARLDDFEGKALALMEIALRFQFRHGAQTCFVRFDGVRNLGVSLVKLGLGNSFRRFARSAYRQ